MASVTITNPRIAQRDGSDEAPIAVSGAYNDAASNAVQVRVLLSADSSVIVDWADVDASLSGDVWSGSVTVPTGGPYFTEARLHDVSDVVLATSTAGPTVYVGDIFVAIGQSNCTGLGFSNQLYTGSGEAVLFRESGVLDTTLSDPWSDGGGSHGSWGPLLATLLSDDLGGTVPLAFIVHAVNGSALDSTGWLPPSGTDFVAAEAQIAGYNLNGIKAVLWIQGEDAVSSGQPKATYAASRPS